eukprot:CAMPEP_0177669204 /NCGR_PEP_ID=MMETSP0447-20121125/23293_1 /TAXON_ID=0 /ORGANISM="Stygamoeba regulata, Strain BSH-02190019" /LENGTH=373 /DNA_ID=CAMNT_0019176009 /DNA_START=175 /DNA_END=1296 /DNA_ORIENTATION=-
MSGNGLVTLPQSLFCVRSLTELELSNNRIVELPAEVAQLCALQRLVLDYNPMRELSESIGTLSLLSELSSTGLRMRKLPAQAFACFSLLTLLDLSHCELEPWLPYELSTLPLRGLDVSYNDLEHLFDPQHQPSLLAWQKMRTLNASHCALVALPDDMGALSSLTRLEVCDNDLCLLPASLCYARALTALLATRNSSLMSLPASLLHLPKLTGLHVTNCYLSLLGKSSNQMELTRGHALPSEPYQVTYASTPSSLVHLAMTVVSRLYVQTPLLPEQPRLLDRATIPSTLWERLRRERKLCAGCGWDFFGEPVVTKIKFRLLPRSGVSFPLLHHFCGSPFCRTVGGAYEREIDETTYFLMQWGIRVEGWGADFFQ